ncbi:MAG: restriction endonuclease subunit S [Sporomusaceae bacterium]|nr:restriction endonuclease subunit S [Sporomusaceae bacterium]
MSQYKPYPAYKDSGIAWLGEVPKHWHMSKVKWEFDTQLGKMLQPTQLDSEEIQVPYYKALTVQWEMLSDKVNETMWASKKEIENYQIVQGDLLVCEGGEAGRSAIVKNNIKDTIIIQNSIHRVRPINNNRNEMLLRLLQTVSSAKWLEVLCNKATIVHFTGEKLGDLTFPVCTVQEQIAIAIYLDNETARIDALIEKKIRFIDLLKEKRQALITNAVTKGLDPNVKMKDSGVAWLGEIPEHWEVKLVKYITTHVGSGKTPSGGAEVYQDAGVIFLRSQNVHDGKLSLADVAYISEKIDEEMRGSRVYEGDILLNITGGSIGRSCHVLTNIGPANVNQHVCIIRAAEKELGVWMATCFVSELIRRQIEFLQTGAGREGLNFEQIRNMILTIPPRREQKLICEHIHAESFRIDLLSEKIQQSINLLKERRSALITAAVTGKIDLREDTHEPNPS